MYYLGQRIDPAEVSDHRGGAFGRWYYGEAQAACGHIPHFKAIEGPHADLHRCVADAVTAFQKGERERSLTLTEQAGAASAHILEHLARVSDALG
jgi:methyl-accepting chemotaxis protein